MSSWFKKQNKKVVDDVIDVDCVEYVDIPLSADEDGSAEKAPLECVDIKLPGYVDALLDSFGNLVRGIGKFSFDLGRVDDQDFSEECEQWARHILLGDEAPFEGESEEEPKERKGYPIEERNWVGAQRFILQHRREEKQYVESSIDDLKSVVVDSLDGLRQLVATDKQYDTKIVGELNALLEVTRDASAKDMRDRASQAVQLVLSVIERRQQEQDDQLSAMCESMSSVRQELYEAQRQMKEDALTRVYNRGAFDESLEKFVRLAKFMKEPFSLVVIDIDHFKDINDSFGHLVGDTVLQCVAREICLAFPRKNDFVARYGGDEFVALLPDTKEDIATKLADRLLDRFKNLDASLDKEILPVTCSIGIAVFSSERDETAIELFARADQALYRAKENGRNCISN